MRIISILVFFFLAEITVGQETRSVNGTRWNAKTIYAITNATVHSNPTTTLDNATILIQDYKIVDAGVNVSVPNNAVVIDAKNKHVFPSFIELNSTYGITNTKSAKGKNQSQRSPPQLNSKKKGPYSWNEAIKAEFRSISNFMHAKKGAEELRNIGFGTVLTYQKDGIARGTSVLTTLLDHKHNLSVLSTDAAAQYSFKKGSSKQSYPSSLMGCIALLRQTYYDANWYKNSTDRKETNESLKAFNRTQELPQFFEISDKLSLLRANKIAKEFGVKYVYYSNGDSYQRINEVANTKAALVVPIKFPKPYEVENPHEAMLVSLKDMKHWELAPTNLGKLEKAGCSFAITSSGLKKKNKFWTNLRNAIKHGLSSEQALAALTTIPAKLIRQEQNLGTIEKGKWANLIIVDGNPFTGKASVTENWIQGHRYVIKESLDINVGGSYELKIDSLVRTLKVVDTAEKRSASLVYKQIQDSLSESGDLVINPTSKSPFKVVKQKKVKATLKIEDRSVSLHFSTNINSESYRLSGWIDEAQGLWTGEGQLPNGKWVKWQASLLEAIQQDTNNQKNQEFAAEPQNVGSITYPFLPYGWDTLPSAKTVLIKNATIWTCEKSGILEESDLLISNGKIAKVGSNLSAPNKTTQIIDAQGKHVTPGIIDEHSHIAISRGVNESGQAISAEVSIQTVVNSDDINIYRHLSGGVTACQLLHGSANPIGGQSAIIKMRWGLNPDQMLVEDAPKFIKFALGENVKQSNWGDLSTIRFPQTRMGVEQVLYDGFHRAVEYRTKWNAFNKNSELPKPRKDLELEVLDEIIQSKRYISCHSYVQSEINMLMHVADSFDFTLNTFTHILEGYKLADKMKQHGAGASTFSDWWAYKYEVNEAIPHNASLLHQAGVLTAINSDDAEMGRRLNQEAAKAIKYGGMSEEDALKLVTLNPAKLLHLDDRMGSIKIGKDADVVIWSDHPLSIYAKAEKTFVDGICYFDTDRDKILREENRKERSRLINKMIAAKKGGSFTQKGKSSKSRLHNCNIITDDGGG